MSINLNDLRAKIQEHTAAFNLLRSEINKVIVGQHHMCDNLLIGLLANGHVLLEGMPGLAKTLAIRTLAQALGGQFSRIQFTPDLLPADVVGTMIYNQQQGAFVVKKGPVFANFVLADEINRAPAKVQSALLEAMQERQVTIGDTSYALPQPFLVLATQNPVDQEGTYKLPEAQVDRFMLKVVVNYPNAEEEKQIIRQHFDSGSATIQQAMSTQQLLNARELTTHIYVDEKIEQYIIDLVFATRHPEQYKLQQWKNYIEYGASPRASIALAVASRAHAFLQQRGYVIPEDVRAVAMQVLRHRVGLGYMAEADNIDSAHIVTDILNNIQVP